MVYGGDYCTNLEPVRGSHGKIYLRGLLSTQAYTGTNTHTLYFAVVAKNDDGVPVSLL